MGAALAIVPASPGPSLHDRPRYTTAMDDPDRSIMERTRAGDQEAMVDLVKRFQDELVGFFYHLSWDQTVSEELAQDVFVNCWRARERWEPTARVRTWLYRIAHNRWIDQCRRKHRHFSLDAESGEQGLRLADVLPAKPLPTSDDQDDQRIRSRVQTAVEALPEGQRAVFVLANQQGLKYSEISDILHIPEGTVKSRMHSAVRQLRDELADLVES